jgi:hypothetical protein
MNFDKQPTVVRISMPVARRDVNSDICEDYTLPDYYPEIRKCSAPVPHFCLPPNLSVGVRWT